MNFAATFNSPFGLIEMHSADGSRLSALRFVDRSDAADSLPIFHEATRWLRRYFAGKDPWPAPALAPRGTEFQLRVWAELRRIPNGERITYGQLARRVRCRSPRAVGQAVGANPLLLLTPCHRVVAANGLGGFVAGQPLKAALLTLELSEK